MEHLQQYIAGLNLAILAGVDVRFLKDGVLVPAVGQIHIDEEQKKLIVTYRRERLVNDQITTVSAKTKFTTEYEQLPYELLDAGWE